MPVGGKPPPERYFFTQIFIHDPKAAIDVLGCHDATIFPYAF
jgi:hypothetical protein